MPQEDKAYNRETKYTYYLKSTELRFNIGSHLDMFVYIASPTKVIVADYDHFPENKKKGNDDVVDDIAKKFEKEGFTVFRVQTPYDAFRPITYTNALVINDRVLVPTYNLPTWDNAAIDVFKRFFPGKTIIGIDASKVIGVYYGAIHCATLARPAVP